MSPYLRHLWSLCVKGWGLEPRSEKPSAGTPPITPLPLVPGPNHPPPTHKSTLPLTLLEGWLDVGGVITAKQLTGIAQRGGRGKLLEMLHLA